MITIIGRSGAGQDGDRSARTWYAPRDAASEWPHRVEVELELNWSRSALVLIDVWDTHPNASFGQAMELAMPAVQSVLEGYRKRCKPVFHDLTGLAMHPWVLAGWGLNDRVIPWDPMGGGTAVLDGHLRELGITTIVWAGFATNLCRMSKPCGFRRCSRLTGRGRTYWCGTRRRRLRQRRRPRRGDRGTQRATKLSTTRTDTACRRQTCSQRCPSCRSLRGRSGVWPSARGLSFFWGGADWTGLLPIARRCCD